MFNRSLIEIIEQEEKENYLRSIPNPSFHFRNPYRSKNASFEVYSNSLALQELLDNSGQNFTVSNRDVPNYGQEDGRAWFRNISSNPIKIDTYTPFSELMEEILEVYNLLGSAFAGVLFIGADKQAFNPLHPLMALTILDTPAIVEEDYRAIVYTYGNRAHLEEIYEENSYADDGEVDKVLDNIIKLYNTRVTNIRKFRVIENSVSDSTVTQKFQVAKQYNEATDYDYYIIPHQLITYGIMAPYYGVSVVRMNDKQHTLGMAITPQMSANISHNYRGEFASVCTGHFPNTSREGMESLNHANLSSAMNDHCTLIGSLYYADRCIETSLLFYKMANLIKEKEHEQQKPTIVTVIDDSTGEIYEDLRYSS